MVSKYFRSTVSTTPDRVEMDNSYDIKITQIYKVTVGASNEEEAMEIAEQYVSTSPEQYATELYSEVESYG